jgi:hypothetical protein
MIPPLSSRGLTGETEMALVRAMRVVKRKVAESFMVIVFLALRDSLKGGCWLVRL